MARHMISVCIFCFICATHSPCASHATTHQGHVYKNNDIRIHGTYNSVRSYKDIPDIEKIAPYFSLNVPGSVIRNNRRHRLEKRNSDISDSNNNKSKNIELDFIKEIFKLYGDGERMDMEGFRALVNQLGAKHQDHSHEHSVHTKQAVHRQLDLSIKTNETEAVNNTVSIVL